MQRVRSWQLCKVVAMVIALALVSAACGDDDDGNTADGSGGSTEPYELALLTDLSGPFSAPAGIPMSNGFMTYIETVNGDGGVNGRQIDVTMYDDRADVQIGVSNYDRAVETDALGIIGVTASALWAVIGPRAEQDGILQTGIGGDQFVLDFHEWVFKIQMVGQDMARQQVEFAEDLAEDEGLDEVNAAVVGYDSPAVRQWAEAIESAVDDLGWNRSSTQFVPTATADFSGVAAQVAQEDPHVIFTNILEGQMPGLVSALRGRGVDVPIVNGVTNITDTVLADIGDEGLYLARDVASVHDESISGVREMREQAEATGNAEGIEGPAFIQGYVHAKVVVDALEACGADCTREGLKDSLETASADPNGLTGPAEYEPDYHVMLNEAAIVRLDPSLGYGVPVEGYGFGD